MVLEKVLVDNEQVATMPVLPDETPGADTSSMRMVLPYFRYNATFDPSFTVLVATNGMRICADMVVSSCLTACACRRVCPLDHRGWQRVFRGARGQPS
jgi:hypothetical protein